ncbi:hypothetical protein [Mesobacillus foraminis]|uniref:hypothetical protein n=1 Tax=Mesobacillus foraminis TaxID=279826 RepID=UPI000EF442C4|nr:hypothetical protein [Mesobacillus foraminis]
MKKAIFWILILAVLAAAYYFFNQERPYETSMTSNIVVIDKKEKDGKFIIEADLPNANTSGTITARKKSD